MGLDADSTGHNSREGNSKSTRLGHLRVIDHVIHIFSGQNDSSFIAETSFVRAPLNSRVVSTPSEPKSLKGKKRQDSLDRVPLDIQEALILEDLLFVLSVRLFLSLDTARLN